MEVTLKILARLRPFPKQIGPVSVVLGGLVSPIELIPPALKAKGFKAAKPPLQQPVPGQACRLPMRKGIAYWLPILILSHCDILLLKGGKAS